MSNKLIYIGILIALIFTQSCTTKEPEMDQLLTRNWQYDAQKGTLPIDSNSYLNLSLKVEGGDTLREFISIFNGRRDIGTWSIKDGNDLILSSPRQNIETGVDSITQSFDENGKVTIHYYKNNELIGSLNNGDFTTKQFIQKFTVNDISENEMTLIFENQAGSARPVTVIPYKYISKVIPTSISFYSVTRGLIGIFGLILITFLFSSNRKAINWNLVLKGLSLQLILAVLVLYVPFVTDFF